MEVAELYKIRLYYSDTFTAAITAGTDSGEIKEKIEEITH